MPCVVRAATLACFLATTAAAWAEQDEPLQVLILTDSNQRSGAFVKVANSFSRELLGRETRPVVLRYIDLNASDEKSISEESVYRTVVERIFQPARPDLVLALGPPAVDFWQRNRGEEFQDVPMIACAAEVGGVDPQFVAQQWAVIARYSFAAQISDLLQLLPDTHRIFLITGSSPHERKLAAVARQQIQADFTDLDLEVSSDLSLAGLTGRVSQLGAGSVIYFVTFETDASGEILLEDEVLAAVRAASTVPVFGPFTEQLGMGVVGGRLIPLEKVGRKLADVAYGIFAGDPPPRGIHYIDLSPPQYDWRQLEAWHIPIRRLPPGSEILFQPPGLWASYRGWIILIIALNAAMAFLILQLSIQRRRARRHAKTNADLSGRLITAYEDERRLIAREMHDDVCQSLARLAIDASLVSSAAGGSSSEERLGKLQDGLARISSYVHELSYRLHPSMVEELGLANALRAECKLRQDHTDISIVVDIQEVGRDVAPAVRLNLYRIGQEALQNAIRHSGASRIDFSLQNGERDIVLTVSDNGQGFDASDARTKFSLGLASMHERATLAGGALSIHSRRDQGTRVQLTVPAAETEK